jgi:hypothetical protein
VRVSRYKSDELFESPNVDVSASHEAVWGKEGYTQVVELIIPRSGGKTKKKLAAIVGKVKDRSDVPVCLVLFTLCSANPGSEFSYGS